MKRLVVVAALLATAACSSDKPTVVREISASLDAARTCARFVNLIGAQGQGNLTAAQARVQIFTMAADLATDAERDAKLQNLADAITTMTDAIKAGDSATETQSAQTVVRECTPLLKAHDLIGP